ncbi:hypothetical protein GCM10011390_32790 [Aureimonas endophytica]|uniref:Uncharacterized protein n=1 Tax=Aureimonas endophytica TaxID=2027858 RepID=A0A916ZSY5_9HYPH|nr:hypothetical protein [Aureimonas endophytica]GGE11194.1 hypothetical protein GCM10011390_32790 [Aureimonas endophytica]
MTIAKKGTLLIVSGPRHDPDRKHLHVICNDPDAEGRVLIVGICSVTAAPHDETCILAAHEHDFLRHPSYVLYARAEIVLAAALANGIGQGVIAIHSAMNGQTFLKVAKGLCRSPQTPRKIKAYAGCPDR